MLKHDDNAVKKFDILVLNNYFLMIQRNYFLFRPVFS